MQDNHQQQQEASQSRNESVRVRWKPTAQQITILENIFNSGTVNPTKDVTVSIRKQLQQYGPVEDVNIFYWFQNRRSRWSRRLRQIQTESAAAAAGLHSDNISNTNNNNHIINFHNVAPSPQFYNYNANNSNSNIHIYNSSSSSSSWDSYTTSTHEQDPGASSSITLYSDTTYDACMPNITAGCIRVSINGKATKNLKRPVDMRTMFGQELVLVHPNGVPVDEFGFDLQHGECYFLVPRHA